ncbi:hypothetical protein [Variovorax sp. dw_954]|uniref:hypothetical protein n=1 Tax=Variovorax sp. dw_954 TaxID=2720078 RepID=UPI001BD4F56F|nr:hypothetical protein [Variovorax sp. dw_954]
MTTRSLVRALTAALAATCIACAPTSAAYAASGGAPALRASYGKLSPRLSSSSFGRPMVLNSTETGDSLKGEVYGVLDQPLSAFNANLVKPARWCEMLMLHLNNRACRVDEAKKTLTLSVVRRYDIPVKDAFELTFHVRVDAATPDYFDAKLSAASGPFGTRNYLISVEGIPLDSGKSFVHFSYTYEQGSATRVATKSYLATFGRDKVGFTVVGKESNGDPKLIGEMLGLVERNAMRYYLALDAYLSAPDDFEKRLTLWYAATQKYPRQLGDLSEADYLKFKRMDRP